VSTGVLIGPSIGCSEETPMTGERDAPPHPFADRRNHQMPHKKIIKRSILASLAVGSLVAALALTGSSSSQAAIGAGTAEAAISSTVPAALAVPAGNQLTSSFNAEGVQVYRCTAGAWVFVEPAANLTGALTTRPWTLESAVHFVGPSWESTTDGSLVTGKAIASSPVTGSIPELLLQAATNRGDGIFGKVSYIQRLRTSGGVAPSGTCVDGKTVGVHYQAEYRFFTPTS
jgi:hypothetical protein